MGVITRFPTRRADPWRSAVRRADRERKRLEEQAYREWLKTFNKRTHASKAWKREHGF